MSDIEQDSNPTLSKLLQNTDLFATGGDDSDSDEECQRLGPPSSLPPPPAATQTKKKKNVGRKPQKDEKKPTRLTKSEKSHMYSEGQRLIRESTVKLPQYRPKPKTLDGFLTKLRSRHTSSSISTCTARIPPSCPPTFPSKLVETTQNKENTPPVPQTQHTTSSPSPPPPPTSVNTESGVNTEPSTDEGVVCVSEKGDEEEQVVRDSSVRGTEAQSLGSKEEGIEEGMEEGRCALSGGETESAVMEDQMKEVERSNTPPPTSLKQRSLTSLFAKQLQETDRSQQVSTPTTSLSTTNQPETLLSNTTDPPKTLLSSTSHTPAPKLSSAKDFLLSNVTETEELTPLEVFQQKLMHQITSSQLPQEGGGGRGGEGEGEGVEGRTEVAKPLISDDVISKLKDKPGAIREVWRSELRRQMSQRLAEERKAVEETKKFYNEELPDEEEAEFTDPDTSDCEFIQNEAEEEGESDGCSDLDEQEGVGLLCEAGSDEMVPGGEGGDMGEGGEEGEGGDVGEGGEEGEGGDMGEGSEGEGEPGDKGEMDGYSAGEESDGGGYFSDNEDILTSRSHPSKKKQRLLDSDDEEDSFPPSSEMENQLADPAKAGGVATHVGMKQPNLIGEEASMGPLVLNENTNTVSTSEGNGTPTLTSQPLAPPTVVDPDPMGEASTRPHVSSVGGEENVVATDSGVGGSLEGGDMAEGGHDTQDTKHNEEEEEGEGERENREGEEKEGEEEEPTQAIPDSDKDNSLESSLLWAPSLAPAQVWRESVETTSHGTDEMSQWQAMTEVSQRILDTQNNSIDEETQFLDANGLLHFHKQKSQRKHMASLLGEATQDGGTADAELLALCSGKFETQTDSLAPPHTPPTWHLSDSNSVQGVRELLGLKQPRSMAGISKLLGSTSDNIERSTSGSVDMNEVLGLCSGAFPATQTQGNSDPLFTKFGANVRNGSGSLCNSSNSENEEEEGGGLLSWAQRQKKLTAMLARGGDKEEEEDAMPTLTRKRRRVRPKPKATKEERLAEFVESEAELSGEDVGSGLEEEEEGQGFSEYEEDEGSQSDVPMSDSELWNQVNKAHMKEALADDKADLHDLKERFLKEGDLYEDGLALKNGFFRSRRFLAQSEGSLDLFPEDNHVDSGGEEGGEGGGAEDSSGMEAKRRKDRLEREEFIRKCREHETSDLLGLDEDSQSILSIIRDTTSHSLLSTPSASNSRSDFPAVPRPSSASTNSRCGSFLRHNTSTLRRLSSITSVTPSVASGKSFVFQKASDTTPHSSHHTDMPSKKVKSSFRPPVKKLKIDQPQLTPRGGGSVFSML